MSKNCDVLSGLCWTKQQQQHTKTAVMRVKVELIKKKKRCAGYSSGLEGQFIPKTIIHIFPLIYSAIFDFGTVPLI